MVGVAMEALVKVGAVMVTASWLQLVLAAC